MVNCTVTNPIGYRTLHGQDQNQGGGKQSASSARYSVTQHILWVCNSKTEKAQRIGGQWSSLPHILNISYLYPLSSFQRSILNSCLIISGQTLKYPPLWSPANSTPSSTMQPIEKKKTQIRPQNSPHYSPSVAPHCLPNEILSHAHKVLLHITLSSSPTSSPPETLYLKTGSPGTAGLQVPFFCYCSHHSIS